MCVECWQSAGSPTVWNGSTARVVELLKELSAINGVGGPLHVQVDDYNITGTITPGYDYWEDEELDALYSDGMALGEGHADAPVVVANEGRSLRQICDELAALLNTMPEAERYSALARYDGFWTE